MIAHTATATIAWVNCSCGYKLKQKGANQYDCIALAVKHMREDHGEGTVDYTVVIRPPIHRINLSLYADGSVKIDG